MNGPCTGTAGAWLGVTCGVMPGGYYRVTTIDTCQWTASACSVTKLGGSLPSSIGGLDALTRIELGQSGILGTIPSSLGACTKLRFVALSQNSLSGNLPSSLGGLTGVTYLSLRNNALSGPVPASLCSLPSTTALSLQSNPGLTCYPLCFLGRSGVTLDATLRNQCGESRVTCASQ